MNQDLNIIINAQDRTKEAFASSAGAFNTFKNKVDDMQPAFKKMAAIGTVAFSAIAVGALSMVNAYADAQAQTEITNQSLANSFENLSKTQLNNLEKALGSTKNALSALSNEAIKAGESAVKLGFDDEEASRSFAKLFAVTKDVTKANKELAIAQDLARFKGITLEEATQKLVMVHAGATKELKALGIAVVDGATAEQNLASIHKQTADSAQTFAETTKGAMEILKVQTDNLKESIGGALEPAFAKLLTAVQPIIEKFAKWAEQNPELLTKIVMIAGAIAGLVAVVGFLGMALPAVIAGFTLLAGPVGIIIALIVAVGVAVYEIVRIFQMLHDDGGLIWEGIKLMVQEKIDAVKNAINTALTYISTTWKKIWTDIKNFFTGIWDSITETAQGAINRIKNFLQPILDMVNNVIAKLASIGNSVTGGIKNAVGKVGSFLGINDGIVQNGKIITTHPDDTILAMKDLSKLGGGQGSIVVNINGGNYLSEDASLQMGDYIIKALQYQMRGA